MKSNGLAIIVGAVFASCYVMAQSGIQEFADAVNDAWASTNDAQIVVLVDGRLAANSNDVAALTVQMYYRLWIEGSVTNARATAERLSNVLSATSNSQAQALIADLKTEVDGIPEEESGPLPVDTLNHVRNETYGQFPHIESAIILGHSVSEDGD